jgi:hypothetical protein
LNDFIALAYDPASFVQTKAADEHRQLSQHVALTLVDEGVAPIEHGGESLMPGRRSATAPPCELHVTIQQVGRLA